MTTEFRNEVTLTRHRAIIIALATNDIIKNDLDELYKNNANMYYLAYKKSPFYEDNILNMYNVEKSVRLQQAIGIYSSSTIRVDDVVLKLMKKGYKKVHQHFYNAKRGVLIEPIFKPFVKQIEKSQRLNRPSEMYTELDMFNFITACYYFSWEYGKLIDDIESLQEFYTEYALKLMNRDELRSGYYNKDLVKFKSEIKELRDKYLPIKDKIISTEDILEYLTFAEHKHFIELTNNVYYSRDDLFKNGEKSKIIGAITGLFDMSDVRDEFFTHKFTQAELDIICLRTIYAKEINNLQPESESMYIYMGLLTYSFSREYFYVREKYLKDSAETLLLQHNIEMDSRKKLLEEQRKTLTIQYTAMEEDVKSKTNLISEKDEYIIKLEKALQEANSKSQLVKPLESEVASLHEYIAELAKSTSNTKENISTQDKVAQLTKYPILLIGGHPNWVRGIQEIIPNIEYISPDDRSKNLNHLNQYTGVILINRSYLAHDTYYKVKGVLNKNTRLVYINNSMSPKIFIDYVYNLVNQK